MGVNNEKYFYINRVGLLRDSWALKKFEEDAEKHHMEDQPGKLVALRLTEYYELREEMKIISAMGGGSTLVPSSSLQAPAARQQAQRGAGPEDDQDEEEAAIPQQQDDMLDDVEDQWS